MLIGGVLLSIGVVCRFIWLVTLTIKLTPFESEIRCQLELLEEDIDGLLQKTSKEKVKALIKDILKKK